MLLFGLLKNVRLICTVIILMQPFTASMNTILTDICMNNSDFKSLSHRFIKSEVRPFCTKYIKYHSN
jgi:hypothetical protein